MSVISTKAYAKINIGLEVLYKRPDGYHEINTVFATTCLADELKFSANDKIELYCDDLNDIPIEENLVYKAAKILQNSAAGRGCKIELRKKIPVGAGLGGGSSNAASTLLTLNKLWELNLSIKELYKIAAQLGSDVPYFLQVGSALAQGRGEILSYFDYSIPFWTLMVNPEIHISSSRAYKSLNIDKTINAPTDFKTIILNSIDDPSILKEHVFNDFEKIVFIEYPEIADIKIELYKRGAIFALLSGSGSTVFSFFSNEQDCIEAANHFGDYRTYICSP